MKNDQLLTILNSLGKVFFDDKELPDFSNLDVPTLLVIDKSVLNMFDYFKEVTKTDGYINNVDGLKDSICEAEKNVKRNYETFKQTLEAVLLSSPS